MKKIYSLLTAATICTCGFAQNNVFGKMTNTLQSRSIADGPIATYHLTSAAAEQLQAVNHQSRRSVSVQQPTTAPQSYALSGYFFTYAGMAYASGLAQEIAIDGNKVYFNNLFPIMLEDRDVWTVGEMNDAGTSISVPVQHIYDDDWYDLGFDVEFYMGDIVFDEEGNITEVRPFEFSKEGDYIYMDDLHEVTEDGYAIANHHIGIFAYTEGEESIELYDYVAGHKFTPFETGELISLPAEAREEQYLYSALDDYGDPVKQVFQVAFNGSDVYFNGLTPDQSGWVRGTLGEDNVVTIPSGQYVGVQKYFYTYFAAMSVAGRDPNGDANFRIEENLKLNYDPETGIFTYADPEVFIGELIYQGNNHQAVQAAYGEITISPLGEAKAATPTDPYEVFIMDLEDYGYEQWDFGFMLDQKGTEDEYLFPENLKVCMFMDDNLFTFDTEDYWIDEPVTYVGYTDIDSNDAFYHDDNVFDFYVNKTFQFGTLSAVALYTVGDETRYSNAVSIDFLTDEVSTKPLTEAQLAQLGGNATDGIEQIKEGSLNSYYNYNLQGQRVNRPIGIVISKNRKMLLK